MKAMNFQKCGEFKCLLKKVKAPNVRYIEKEKLINGKEKRNNILSLVKRENIMKQPQLIIADGNCASSVIRQKDDS